MMNRRVVVHSADGSSASMRDVGWDEVRAHRNAALGASDWRAVEDRVLPNTWKDYRQTLRDIPQDYDTANEAADNFPQPPE